MLIDPPSAMVIPVQGDLSLLPWSPASVIPVQAGIKEW